MRHANLVLPLILAFGIVTPSFAETVEWSSAAMACTPTASTVEQSRYVTTAGRVKFKDDKYGLISFICPVSKQLRNGEYVLRSHLTNGRSIISIVLRQSTKDGYSVANILDADIFFTQGGSKYSIQHSGNPLKTLSFDNKKYYYWVQITIKKSKNIGADTQAIHGVELIRK